MQILGQTLPSIESLLGSLNLLQLGFIGMIIVILLVFTVRITLSFRGTKYTAFRVAFVPIVYTLFTIYLFYQSVGINLSILGTDYVLRSYVLLIPVGLVVGLILGIIAGKSVRIYEKNGRQYFKKSLAVSFFWTLCFVLQFVSLVYYPAINIGLIFTGLLAVATGMLDGQALRAHTAFRAEIRQSSA